MKLKKSEIFPDYRNKKAQVGIETIFSAIVLIAILAFSAIYSIYERDSNKQLENNLAAVGICWKMANLVTEVFASGDGASVNASFAENYTFQIFPSSKFITVVSTYTGAQSVCTMPVTRVSNSTSSVPASFWLKNITALQINNIGGLVVVS